MKKTADDSVFLVRTVIAVLLAFTAGATLYARLFFMSGIVAVLAVGMVVHLFIQKSVVPSRLFNEPNRPREDETIAGQVSDGEPNLVPDSLSAVNSSDNAGDYAVIFPCNKTIGDGDVPSNRDAALLVTLSHAVPELNIKAGFAHTGRNNEAYFNMLRRFCEEYDEHIREIVRLMAEESWMDYSVKMRSLKGLFADMGSEHLSTWAHKLESAFSEYDNVVCKNETEPFCYAMYLFKEKLAAAMLLKVADYGNNENNGNDENK
jgi:HPt (histidine-containing phosphotransfer) domain-containing protein